MDYLLYFLDEHLSEEDYDYDFEDDECDCGHHHEHEEGHHCCGHCHHEGEDEE